MNFMQVAGHLGSDPEVRFTSTGKKVTTLRVATRGRKTQNGEETIWWSVSVWGEQFDKMISYLKKGSPIIVFGELHKPRIYNDREGKPQVAMEITASHLEFSPFGRSQGQGGPQDGMAAQTASEPSSQFTGSAPASPNPYFGGTAQGAAFGASNGGDTIDDEVPF